MGWAIAEKLAYHKANVTLISGPSSVPADHPDINLIQVTTADEMYHAALDAFNTSDGAVLAAAVADFRPVKVEKAKIKSKKDQYLLRMEPTIDIAAELGKRKKKGQFLIGFALETDNEIENACDKLVKKNFDFIVLNSLKDKGAGFGHDTNKISIIDKSNKITHFGLKSKEEVASDIINKLTNII